MTRRNIEMDYIVNNRAAELKAQAVGLNLVSSLPINFYHGAALLKIRELQTGTVVSWNDVSEIHKIRNGIYQRNGRLISLLTDFGRINPCYPDLHGDSHDVVYYTGSGRRGDQKLDAANRALMNAIESKLSVPLFNKLAVGRWEFTGFWQVTNGVYVYDAQRARMVWRFTLNRADS